MAVDRKVRFEMTARDKTSRAFKSVRNGIKSVGKAVFNLKTAFAAAAGAAGVGLLIKNSFEAIDRIDKLSRTLGISTKNLVAFELAAELGGSSLTTLARAARQVSKNVFDFVIRGTGEASDAFEEMGITVDDLRPIMNDQIAIIGLIADKFALMEDGAVKTALAMKLFGGRAAELLPALAGGSKAFEDARKEVEAFGKVLSVDQIKAVTDANDAITRLKSAFTGIVDQIAAKVAPHIIDLADSIRENMTAAFRDSIPVINDWVDTLVNAFKSITSDFDDIAAIEAKIAEIDERIFQIDVRRELGLISQVRQIELQAIEIKKLIVLTDALAKATKRASKQGRDVRLKPLAEIDVPTLPAVPLENIRKVNEILSETDEIMDRIKTVSEEVGNTIAESFENAATSGENLRDTVKALVLDIAKLVFRQSITQPLAASISTGLGSLARGFLFGGTNPTLPATGARLLAAGGTVRSGEPVIVGDGGKPELFVPRSAGTVLPSVPSVSQQDQQENMAIIVNISTGVTQTVRAEIQNLLPQIVNAVSSVVVDRAQRRGIA